MLSPAHLLLIERLIVILMALLRAIDLADDGQPNLRRAGARLLLSRLADQLARLREQNPATPPEPAPASPTRVPLAIRVQPRRAEPGVSNPSLAPERPPRSRLRSKTHRAPAPTHA